MISDTTTDPAQKIFGIGLSKTGTTSLARALHKLGYPTKDFPSIIYKPHRLVGLNEEQLHHYTAFTDISVVPFYKELDKRFPNAKFIYTIRDKKEWLASCAHYPRFNRSVFSLPLNIIKLRQEIYGTVKFDEEKFAAAYEKHHKDVMKHFKDRPTDLLVLNICEGQKWQPLCQFLQEPQPEEQFPFANVRVNGHA
ncbi:MAG: sulfotransferase family protein [Bacteroidota bacterium]